MQKKISQLYYFVNDYNYLQLSSLHKNVQIIYRNYKKNADISTLILLNKYCKKNMPILSVHDSYITQNQHSGELREVMNKVVTEELTGFRIKIDQEGIGSDQVQAFKNMDRSNSLD